MLQLNTHTPYVYVCGFAWSDMVHGCMVYAGPEPRRLQFHVTPAMPALQVHHFGGYSKTRYKKARHSCRITCEHSESVRERRIALYKWSSIKQRWKKINNIFFKLFFFVWQMECFLLLCFLISTEVVHLQRWHGWCHMKLQPSRRKFCVHHTTMHHVTSRKATYVRCMRV